MFDGLTTLDATGQVSPALALDWEVSEDGTVYDFRLRQDVTVALNRLVLDYDHVLICGPVFPHEVVGFSGGTKYLFPGIAGAGIIMRLHEDEVDVLEPYVADLWELAIASDPEYSHADEADRRKALKQLLPFQRRDFEGIFKAMNGLPVTIRLLDPPLQRRVADR